MPATSYPFHFMTIAAMHDYTICFALTRGTFEVDVVVIDGEPARLLWKGKVFDAEGYEYADYGYYDFEDDFMKKLTDMQRFVEGCYRLENLLRQAREKLVELVSGVYSDFP